MPIPYNVHGGAMLRAKAYVDKSKSFSRVLLTRPQPVRNGAMKKSKKDVIVQFEKAGVYHVFSISCVLNDSHDSNN